MYLCVFSLYFSIKFFKLNFSHTYNVPKPICMLSWEESLSKGVVSNESTCGERKLSMRGWNESTVTDTKRKRIKYGMI